VAYQDSFPAFFLFEEKDQEARRKHWIWRTKRVVILFSLNEFWRLIKFELLLALEVRLNNLRRWKKKVVKQNIHGMKATLIVALDYEKRRNSSSTMLIVVVNFDGRIWKKKKVVKHLSRPWLSPKSGNNSEVHLTILDEEILKWVEHNTITQTCQYKKFLKATRTSSPYTWFESFTFQSFWSFQEASERHSKRCVKQRSRLYTSPIISKNWSSYKKLISPKNYHFEVATSLNMAN
jgi:hypothetical protein